LTTNQLQNMHLHYFQENTVWYSRFGQSPQVLAPVKNDNMAKGFVEGSRGGNLARDNALGNVVRRKHLLLGRDRKPYLVFCQTTG
jgi:hypothetical protein